MPRARTCTSRCGSATRGRATRSPAPQPAELHEEVVRTELARGAASTRGRSAQPGPPSPAPRPTLPGSTAIVASDDTARHGPAIRSAVPGTAPASVVPGRIRGPGVLPRSRSHRPRGWPRLEPGGRCGRPRKHRNDRHRLSRGRDPCAAVATRPDPPLPRPPGRPGWPCKRPGWGCASGRCGRSERRIRERCAPTRSSGSSTMVHMALSATGLPGFAVDLTGSA